MAFSLSSASQTVLELEAPVKMVPPNPALDDVSMDSFNLHSVLSQLNIPLNEEPSDAAGLLKTVYTRQKPKDTDSDSDQYSDSIGHSFDGNPVTNNFDNDLASFGSNFEPSPTKANASAAFPFDVPHSNPIVPRSTSERVSAAARATDKDKKKKKNAARATNAPGDPSGNEILDHIKYKTRLCRNWLQTHRCPYGDGCAYAHGAQEMRRQHENEAVVTSLSKLVGQMSRTTKKSASKAEATTAPGRNAKSKGHKAFVGQQMSPKNSDGDFQQWVKLSTAPPRQSALPDASWFNQSPVAFQYGPCVNVPFTQL
jgi:hypothetical protein